MVALSNELVKSPIENDDVLKPEKPDDGIEEGDLLLDWFYQCDLQILSGNFQWNTWKTCSCSNVEQLGPLWDLFSRQSGKGIDEMLDDNLISPCDTCQIDRSIPDLKLF
jgi:hypothetical protein